METVAPTKERLRQSPVEAPLIDRQTNRRAYMAHAPAETMFRAGLIEHEHVKAAEKFAKHYEGSLGYDVRYGDETGHPDCEDPRTYHAQVINKAMRQLTQSQSVVMVTLTEDPRASLEDLGRRLSGYTERRQAKAAGTTIAREAMETLAIYWGIKSRDSP